MGRGRKIWGMLMKAYEIDKQLAMDIGYELNRIGYGTILWHISWAYVRTLDRDMNAVRWNINTIKDLYESF